MYPKTSVILAGVTAVVILMMSFLGTWMSTSLFAMSIDGIAIASSASSMWIAWSAMN